jgi:hypothetical protein
MRNQAAQNMSVVDHGRRREPSAAKYSHATCQSSQGRVERRRPITETQQDTAGAPCGIQNRAHGPCCLRAVHKILFEMQGRAHGPCLTATRGNQISGMDVGLHALASLGLRPPVRQCMLEGKGGGRRRCTPEPGTNCTRPAAATTAPAEGKRARRRTGNRIAACLSTHRD